MKSINFIQAPTRAQQRSVRLWWYGTIFMLLVVVVGASWLIVPELIVLQHMRTELKTYTPMRIGEQSPEEYERKKTELAELKRRIARIDRLAKSPHFPLQNLTQMALILSADVGIQSVNWQGSSITATLSCKNSENAVVALQALKKSGHFSHLKLVALSKGTQSMPLQATIKGTMRVA